MTAYEFTVYMCGHGDTPEKAWEGAVENMLGSLKEFSNTANLPDHSLLEDEPQSEEYTGDTKKITVMWNKGMFPGEHKICNLEDLYVLLGRMPEESRKECVPLLRMPDGSLYNLVSLTTDGEKPDWADQEEQPVLLAEN